METIIAKKLCCRQMYVIVRHRTKLEFDAGCVGCVWMRTNPSFVVAAAADNNHHICVTKLTCHFASQAKAMATQ